MRIAGATARPSIAGGRAGAAVGVEPTHAGVMVIAAAFRGRGGATAGVMAAEDRTMRGLAVEDEAAVIEGAVRPSLRRILRRLQCGQGRGASRTQDS
jgi:hypothetical protein